LAKAVLAASPECARALRYVLVERSALQRARHGEHLALESPSSAFATAGDPEGAPPVSGPIVVSLAELPPTPVVGVILANELLDNLPFALLQRTAEGWHEVLVGGDQDQLTEVLVEAPIGHRDLAQDLAPDAPVGSRIPVALGAWAWLADALGHLERGRLVAIDYAATTAELAARPDWLRTYRAHERGHQPLDEPGQWDITAEVPLDQLPRIAAPTSETPQADFLRSHGLDELVAEGRRIWTERAAIGDLAALRARSRIGEAEALCDPAGLGAFTVMEWVVS
jgi:SAM-dependent MidA family methyltransferase